MNADQTKVRFYDTADDALLRFAVIAARYKGKRLFCRHRDRDTLEMPGGHREPGETILSTAKRELYEETGAVRFSLVPVCAYSVTAPDNYNGEETFGDLFYAEIEALESELHSEIGQVYLLDALPSDWTYPRIQPALIAETERRGIGQGITIEEVPLRETGAFWESHIRYLTEDGIISDEEDIAYFSGEEYRGILEERMARGTDRHHLVYFRRDGCRIGAASYDIDQSGDGKCFVMDFWVFPAFRGNGTGHRCFEALERYTRADGAVRYEINSTKEDSVRFWRSIGFAENGRDEYDMPLFVKG